MKKYVECHSRFKDISFGKVCGNCNSTNGLYDSDENLELSVLTNDTIGIPLFLATPFTFISCCLLIGGSSVLKDPLVILIGIILWNVPLPSKVATLALYFKWVVGTVKLLSQLFRPITTLNDIQNNIILNNIL